MKKLSYIYNKFMLTFEINHQEEYSRGELLLRTFFGWLYIALPHGFLLMLCGIALWFIAIGAFFVILFTGVTPTWYVDWVIPLQRWGLRLSARIYNLADGYPAFGLDGKDDKTEFKLEPWQIGPGQLLLRTFLGWLYVGIPHGLILCFRSIGMGVLIFLSFFAVLFTGKYPENWHRFNVGTLRWQARVGLYLSWLYRDYPPFSGLRDENLLGKLDHLGNA